MAPKLKITPILLCGGSGTRLWPLSRRSYPKQFSPLIGDESLFQASVRRVSGVGFAKPVVVTGSDFRFIVTQQMAEMGVDPGAVLLEPAARNTAPAVLAALIHIAATDPQATVLISPSDHVVRDVPAFHAALATATEAAADGRIVTFGIRPDRPETGYGYLELAGEVTSEAATPLQRFVEKPDRARAEAMLTQGRYLWNAGIFLARVDTLLAAFETHAADLVPPVRAAVDQATPDLGFLRLAPGPWDQAADISIDYAVMERAPALSVVPFDGGWSDLGGWETVWREMGPDASGVATSGAVHAIDCTGTLLRAEGEGQVLIGLGLENMIAIAMPDAVLVAPMDRAQDLRLAVAALKSAGAKQATEFPKDHRPWGWFESLVLGERFQVKRIHVNPGAALSLQSHHHRAEHWIVVQGTAKVTVGGEVSLVTENQSVYIPLGATHRMENPGKVPMVLIEVQTGTYLGEDDIVRYEDGYGRG
ncbi:mannose-1-phosphate guanylyltransferase/mannose-6-phosphate isomerase [Roseicyclus mahoneyensis]|uniref:mannose-1-phosphate guanylyltransferase n=1 Tax=Roseicyclus mahoneyensis TaxID=164332 RepID=A0A316GFU2_9RHOB|nr:mannose-1-phosphate guanylyltransferase/mannose-6-phosphate isomerase [Roseicyclus mahoneyensis]PWK59105.1 mannose-1-phosphate guanylyltransferase/mannose-6-phosphate isomerase [Roseicyclus mahoneyensis]